MSNLLNRVREVEQILENANAASIKLRASGLYSAAGAEQMTSRLMADARSQAQKLAAEIEAQAAKAVELALFEYRRIYAQVTEEQSTPRAAQVFAIAQAKVATVRDNSEIVRIVEQALLVNDQTMLMALHDVTLPGLMDKATRGPSGFDRMTLQQLMLRIEDAVRVNGDQRIPNAEQKLQAAIDEQNAVKSGLSSVNFRQSMRNGGRGPLEVGNAFFDVSTAAADVPSDVMSSFNAAVRLIN